MTEGEVAAQYLLMIRSIMRHKMLSTLMNLSTGILKPQDIQSDNVLFNAYAVLSWAYYRDDHCIVPDAVYDQICVELARRAKLESATQDLKNNLESFEAGTGFDLNYSLIVPDAETTYRIYQFQQNYTKEGPKANERVRKVPASGTLRHSGN